MNIRDLQDSDNINEMLSNEDSRSIGLKVVRGYESDKSSRKRWETKMEDATKLALQITEDKTYPWPDAANVKFPLVTIAAMQFAARAYPALVKAPDLVKYRKQGQDPGMAAAAARISAHMSWQMLEQDEDWEEEHDKALLALPILGCVFKKTYFDPVKGHNCSKMILPKNLVINYYAKSLDDCERKTEVFTLSNRKIKEKQLRGLYSNISFTSNEFPEPDSADQRQGLMPPFEDQDRPRTILQQHCFLDLDKDGYKEPYVVTVDKATGEVYRIQSRFDSIVTEQALRIQELTERMQALAEGLPRESDGSAEQLSMMMRAEQQIKAMQEEINMLSQQKPKILSIKPIEYFTKYSFIPSPDGGFYDLGFGALLGPLNESVNTLINQLLDSGSLSNGSVGFIGKGARIKGGKVRFSPNEWKRVSVAGSTLKDSLVPLPVNQPSPVLFNLLSLLISYAERVGSVTDAMTGQNPGQNTPAYNMQSMLEQGMQIFNGVFKRVYRSMRGEFRRQFALNALYMPEREYIEYNGTEDMALRADYTLDNKKLIPAADPNAFSNKEKQSKAMILAERSGIVPGYNPIEVEKRFLDSMDIPDIDSVFPTQQNEETGGIEYVFPPQPDPELEIKKAEEERKTLESKVRGEVDISLAEAKLMESEAKVALMYAQASAAGEQLDLKRIELILSELQDKRKALVELTKLEKQEKKESASNKGTSS